MNCSDFERTWNERLDAREALSPEDERALRAHSAACPSCLAFHRRFVTLNHAIGALGPAPAVPAGFAERVLAAAERGVDRAPNAWRIASRLVPLAAAAAVLALVGFGLRGWGGNRGEADRPAGQPSMAVNARSIDPDNLTAVLSDATSATWQLAREASAPAARVGRDMLGETELPAAPGALSLPDSVEPAADVLQRVGARVNAGVRPLEGTARHAFSFLLGTSADDPKPPPRAAEGA
jgi:hypothetical protein